MVISTDFHRKASHHQFKAVQNMEKIILDTDFETDCDDVGALCTLHALEKQGDVEILGVIASVCSPWPAAGVRALNLALDDLTAMRKREGNSLRGDMMKKLDAIDGLRESIATRAPTVVEEYRAKLSQRLSALLSGDIDEARFATEVAIFADRAAIDEELVRLSSHIAQLRATAELDEPVGRKLDFLVQELNREVNTIGSKASDAQIAGCVVAAKGEIEKLREQVQNIE